MKKNYPAIDLIKFILAIFIIAFHAEVFLDINIAVYKLVLMFTNLAVPLFFAFSGFFADERLRNKQQDESHVFMNSYKRLFLMWIMWELVYSPFIIWGWKQSIDQTLATYLWNVIIFGSYAHLWYLRATIIGFLIISVLYKLKISEKKIVLMSAVVYLTGAIMLSYIDPNNIALGKIYLSVFGTFRNGLFFAFPCLLLGMLYSKYRNSNLKLHQNVTRIAKITIIIFYFIENILNKNIGQMTIFMLPMTLVLLDYLVKHPLEGDFRNLRKMSASIYLIHYAFYCVIMHISRSVYTLNSIKVFLITAAGSIIFAITLIKIQKIKAFSWTKYLS